MACRLHIKICEAKKVLKMNVSGESFPYVTLRLKSQGKEDVQKTEIRDTLDPIWNQEFDIVAVDPNDILLINMYSKDILVDDKMMDELEYPVNSWPIGGPLDRKELDIKHKKKKAGKFIFEVQSFPAEIQEIAGKTSLLSRIQEIAGDHLNLPKVIIIGNTGTGKTSLLSALGGQRSSDGEPFNFSVDPQHRFILCDFMSIVDKDSIISNIIHYLFETCPNTDNKVTILLAETEVNAMSTRLSCVIENIKKAKEMFGKLCQLEARFGIVITKCTETDVIKEEIYEQIDKLPDSQIDGIKAYFDHIFMMPKIDNPETFEDKERIISFILGKYIEPEEPEQLDDEYDLDDDEIEDYDDIEETEKSVEEEKKEIICTTCSNPIEADKVFYYSGFPYHLECVKCSKCNKPFNIKDNVDEFSCITPGVFLCKQHYEEQFATEEKDEKLMEVYKEKKIETFVDEVSNQSLLKEEDTSNYSPKEVLMTPKMVEKNTIVKNPYEELIPSMSLNFAKDPKDIDFDKLPKVLGDDVAILDVKKKETQDSEAKLMISTIIKIALLSAADMIDPKEIKEEHLQYIKKLKKRLNPTVENKAVAGNLDKDTENTEESIDKDTENTEGNQTEATEDLKGIVGDLAEDPTSSIPDISKVNDAINKPSVNQLQNTVELNEKEILEIRKKICETLKTKKCNEDWKYIFSHEDMYNELDEQILKDIEDNPYEMINVGQTIITSKYFDEYGKIRNKIPQENIKETFFYHGSKLKNHQKIIRNHFYMPDQDKNYKKENDDGYYGKGIYATDNMFYASMYANGYKVLDINQKTYVICCRSIYNTAYKNDLTQLTNGQPIDSKIKKNYGVNHALVGSSKGFLPITEEEKDINKIWANEFVFANKYQFIPCYSFTVMRKDHYIIWKDDNIDNVENSKYLNELAKTMEVNVYHKKTVDEALDVVKKKKYAAVKLITNAGNDLSGKDLIIKARKVVGSNFVCLVFANSLGHMEWVSKMENVLFTNDFNDFLEFAGLKMSVNEVLKFVDKLKLKYEKTGYQFKIKEIELLHFPKCLEISPYYKDYYAGYVPPQSRCLVS